MKVMDPARVQLVQQSFGHCLLNTALGKAFLDAFYDEFLASDPRIKPMFSNTDMKKQKDLLRQGLVTLIMYGKGSGLAQIGVEQLAFRHRAQTSTVDHRWGNNGRWSTITTAMRPATIMSRETANCRRPDTVTPA
jgi:hypothetical protein